MMNRRHRVHVYIPEEVKTSARGAAPAKYRLYLENLPCNISRTYNAAVQADETVKVLPRRAVMNSTFVDAAETIFYDAKYPPLPPKARVVWPADSAYGREKTEFAVAAGAAGVYGRSAMLRHRAVNLVKIDTTTPGVEDLDTDGRYRDHGLGTP